MTRRRRGIGAARQRGVAAPKSQDSGFTSRIYLTAAWTVTGEVGWCNGSPTSGSRQSLTGSREQGASNMSPEPGAPQPEAGIAALVRYPGTPPQLSPDTGRAIVNLGSRLLRAGEPPR
jgi:hypothetical protein